MFDNVVVGALSGRKLSKSAAWMAYSAAVDTSLATCYAWAKTDAKDANYLKNAYKKEIRGYKKQEKKAIYDKIPAKQIASDTASGLCGICKGMMNS